MNKVAQQTERFRELLGEINEEISGLKSEIKELKKDNSRLKTKLAEARDKQTDIFSAINESERLAMRQHIQGRFKTYREQLVKQPESTVMSLAALSIAEELFEARNNSSELEKNEHHTMERVNKSLEKLLLQIKEE